LISSPITYLFILASVATVADTLEKKTQLKIFKILPTFVIIFLFSLFLGFIGLFEHNNEIYRVYTITKTNLLSAMFFLIFLGFDFKNFLKVGCACNIGAKRYWLLIFISVVVSFLSQFVAWHVDFLDKTLSMVLFSSTLGILFSFSRLRYINGSSEVATTMFYIIIALYGSQLL